MMGNRRPAWAILLVLLGCLTHAAAVGTLHDRDDPLVAVYDEAVPADLLAALKENFETMQTRGQSAEDRRIGQANKAWFDWPPPRGSASDDLLVSWIRYLVRTVPELAANGPYAAVDYWLQNHPHTQTMWFHYDLG